VSREHFAGGLDNANSWPLLDGHQHAASTPVTKESTVNNLTLIANLIDRLNHNQLAIGAAIEELSNWVEQSGSIEVADNVRGALMARDENLVFVRQGIAELVTAGALDNADEQS
jgi:hypothetical protein